MKLDRRSMLLAAGVGLTGGLAPTTAPRAGAHRAAGLARLVANENPYGPGPAAREALDIAVRDSWQYAFRQAGELKKLIAAAEDVSPAHVMIGAGSGEVLRIVTLMQLQGGGEVIAARPTFGFVPSYARRLGADVIEIDLDEDMRHDLDAMARSVSDRTRLVYVCNPNNPTGTRLAADLLREFAADVSRRCPVLVDEAYIDLAEQHQQRSAVARVRAGDDVIVTRTFSKLHGMAGLRIGYAIAAPKRIERIEGLRMSMLNLAGLRAALASFQDAPFLQYSREKIAAGIAITTAALDELGRPYAAPYGNFVFFDTGGSVREFSAAMRGRGFLVGRSYAPYSSWCRVSMGTTEQMQAFASLARSYFAT